MRFQTSKLTESVGLPGLNVLNKCAGFTTQTSVSEKVWPYPIKKLKKKQKKHVATVHLLSLPIQKKAAGFATLEFNSVTLGKSPSPVLTLRKSGKSPLSRISLKQTQYQQLHRPATRLMGRCAETLVALKTATSSQSPQGERHTRGESWFLLQNCMRVSASRRDDDAEVEGCDNPGQAALPKKVCSYHPSLCTLCPAFGTFLGRKNRLRPAPFVLQPLARVPLQNGNDW